MKLSSKAKTRLVSVAASTAVVGSFGAAMTLGVLHDNAANAAKHKAYASSLAANGDTLCRLGTSASAGDQRILDAKVMALQIQAKVDPGSSRNSNPSDILRCKDGVSIRILGDDSFDTTVYRGS